MSEICNGYCISGNLAEKGGRKYEVSDSSGSVLHTTDSKRKAMDYAEALPFLEIQPEEETAEETEDEPAESEE